MSETIRDRAEKILSEVPPLGQQVTSVGSTAALFTKLTGGVTQKTLEANWATGGILTTCNAFTGWFAGQLGSKEYLGRFDLDTYLPKMNKGHAWVPAKHGGRPKYGDIVRFKKFHVGISLDFDGDTWNTAESGQGGPKAGCDILKRKQTTFDGDALIGWVDLELYFNAPAQITPVPDWLLGWWKVNWRATGYYYYFHPNRKVIWTEHPPRTAIDPPLGKSDTGNFMLGGNNDLTIRWLATGSVETFNTPVAATIDRMHGAWNGTDALTAEKIE
jgi:hypothetical protein